MFSDTLRAVPSRLATNAWNGVHTMVASIVRGSVEVLPGPFEGFPECAISRDVLAYWIAIGKGTSLPFSARLRCEIFLFLRSVENEKRQLPCALVLRQDGLVTFC